MGIGPMEFALVAILLVTVGVPIAIVVWLVRRGQDKRHSQAEIERRLSQLEAKLDQAGPGARQ